MASKYALAARQALRIIGRPARIPEIWRVIETDIELEHDSLAPEQTLRNEMRKNCDTCSHIAQGDAYLFFTQPSRGLYALREWQGNKAAEAPTAEEKPSSPSIPPPLPEEVFADDLGFREGASHAILINAYERDPRARQACINHWGTACVACGFDFGQKYGELGQGFIHVHHIVPLSETSYDYELDPIKDLRPVCPNCHAMLHRKRPVLQIDDLVEIIT